MGFVIIEVDQHEDPTTRGFCSGKIRVAFHGTTEEASRAAGLDWSYAMRVRPLYATTLKRFNLEDEIALWQHWATDDIARDAVRAIIESEYGIKARNEP